MCTSVDELCTFVQDYTTFVLPQVLPFASLTSITWSLLIGDRLSAIWVLCFHGGNYLIKVHAGKDKGWKEVGKMVNTHF